MLSRLTRAVVIAVLLAAVGACSSTSSRTIASDSTAGSSETTTSALVGDSTTSTSPKPTAAPEAVPTTTKSTTPPTPKPTAPPTAPPTTAVAGPKVTASNFSTPSVCASPDVSFVTTPPTVHITWTATGADSVYVAIDNQDGPYASDLPLVGSMDLNFSCPGPHTYWVVAVKGSQKDYKSRTFG